jgi:hypothetical protein
MDGNAAESCGKRKRGKLWKELFYQDGMMGDSVVRMVAAR